MDGDPAGRNASSVIAPTLRPRCSVRVILLPDGVPPDQLAEKDIGKLLRSSTNDDYQFGNILS